MAGFLLDTNVLSELMRREPAGAVVRWLGLRPATELYVSVITLGELVQGVARLPSGAQRARLAQRIERIPSEFGRRLLPFDRECAVLWGEIMAAAARAGRPRPGIDGQIAATAACHGLAIATRDRHGFSHLDVTVIDPWAEA